MPVPIIPNMLLARASDRCEARDRTPHFCATWSIRLPRVTCQGLSEGTQKKIDMPSMLVTDAVRHRNPEIAAEARAHVLHWARHPDPTGTFARFTGILRKLPDEAMLMILRTMAYDGLLFFAENKVVAHTFFQRRRANELHVFSIFRNAELEKSGFGKQLVEGVIEHARSRLDISRIRIGGNGDSGIRAICAELRAIQNRRGFCIDQNQWVSFTQRDLNCVSFE